MIWCPPVLALGKASLEVVNAFAAASVVIEGVVVANFPVGTPVWTAEMTTYAETQYRGRVTVSGGTSITVEYAATAQGDAPVLWKPTSYFKFTYPALVPASSFPLSGMRLSLGGTPYKTLSTTPKEVVTLAWDRVERADFTSLRTFILTTLNYGLETFTLAWYDGATNAVRTGTIKLANDTFPFQPETPELRSVTLTFIVDTDALYT